MKLRPILKETYTAEQLADILLSAQRDLQAQKIKPNIRVPSRKKPFSFVAKMREGGMSRLDSIQALFKPGCWTSSGGSFKLAGLMDFDLEKHIATKLSQDEHLVVLEVGAAYAGREFDDFNGLYGLAKKYKDQMGSDLELHFTNLESWHDDLPNGMYEHDGFTAATIDELITKYIKRKPDVIYSQAAAYFDQRFDLFLDHTCNFLNEGGIALFNAKEENQSLVHDCVKKYGLSLTEMLIGENNGYGYLIKK